MYARRLAPALNIDRMTVSVSWPYHQQASINVMISARIVVHGWRRLNIRTFHNLGRSSANLDTLGRKAATCVFRDYELAKHFDFVYIKLSTLKP
jgi:hypothetical protein